MTPPSQPLISLLERIVSKKILLKTYGDPKRVILWLGWRLAAWTKAKWDRKEERTVLGQKMLVRVYAESWWDKWGDQYVDWQLGLLAKHSEWLTDGKIPGDEGYHGPRTKKSENKARTSEKTAGDSSI